MQALTTIFTAPSWCSTRFGVAIDNNPWHSSTLSPTRGWADPSFSQCVPSQYTESLQTISPGVCPDYMSVARTISNVDGDKTIWTGACCQSGFTDMSGYFCTSTVTTPMAFFLLHNIKTTDIYTTLSNLWIEHDEITVAWEETDLKQFPKEIATYYANIMGITLTTTVDSLTITTTASTASTDTESGRTRSTVPTKTLPIIPVPSTESVASPTVITVTSQLTASESQHTATPSTPSNEGPRHTVTVIAPSNAGSRSSQRLAVSLIAWLALLCAFL
ncbi:hypothetical protein GGR54DRAFT_389609 [Hypoxylon sp. NC1633]|nr:hypothetical protein GGR54DRAFT_389609 [Hypoxylon sp. NC1633]